MYRGNSLLKGRWIALTAFFLGLALAMTSQGAQMHPPELSAWLINKTGATGFNGQLANVQSVQYSDNNVYVRSTGIPMGPIGYLINGVPIFNMSDGHSYNNQNTWNQNAFVFEGQSFDGCGGIPSSKVLITITSIRPACTRISLMSTPLCLDSPWTAFPSTAHEDVPIPTAPAVSGL